MKRRIVNLLLTSVLALGLIGCGNSETATNESASNGDVTEETVDQDVTVRIAYNGGIYSITDVGFNSAYLTGHLEEELDKIGVDFEILNFENGAAVNEALLADEIDIVNSMGDQPLVLAIANGIDVAALGVLSESGAGMGIVVAPGSDITEVEQLKGKKIACSIGSTGHKYIINVLSSAGISADDVELVNLADETSQIAALAKGEIDAAVMVSNLSTAEEQGIGTVLDTPEVPTYIYIETTGSFISEHEDVVKVYVDSIKWGENWYKENEEEYYELAADYWDLEVDEVKTYFSGDGVFDAKMPENTAAYLKNTADFLLAQDLIAEELDEATIEEHLYDLWD